MSKKTYRSDDINVTFDLERCIHAEECIRGLPEVFDFEKRPWIQPDKAAPKNVAEVIMRCPTGALHFERKDGGDPESVPAVNLISIAKDGPLYLRGDIEIKEYDGTIVAEDTRVALCRCGASQNKPFCDNSHRNSGFRDEGTLEKASNNEEPAEYSRLTVTTVVNGPLFLKGGFEIRDSKGVSSYQGSKAVLCRCGYSGNKPFCDSSHVRLGWRDN